MALVMLAAACGSSDDDGLSQRVESLEAQLQALRAQLELQLDVELGDTDADAPADVEGEGDGVAAGEEKEKADAPDPSTWTFDLKGLGPIEAGMTAAKVEELIGGPLTHEGFDFFGGSCWFASTPSLGGISFLFVSTGEGGAATEADGIVGRVSAVQGTAGASSWQTLSGVKVGDPAAKVRSTYGDQIEAQPHAYVEGGEYLTFVPTSETDQEFRIRFFTDGSVVQEIHAGDRQVSGYIEGCA
ncbi:MAG TPA: hypothetical protein VGA13_05340 [Acidimicrobiales bacterium]